MPIIEDRLVPCDGLNNYNVYLTRMDLELHGGAQFTFAVTHSMLPVGELSVSVASTGQGMDRMAVDAHDGLIDILRQLLFRAEKARQAHLRNSAREPVKTEPEEESFLMERRVTPIALSDPEEGAL
jgi:hypothetical protein